MSVVGFDIGTGFTKVAVAHQKKISIVPNDLSKLATPTLTAFTNNERLFGEGAVSQWARNYKYTIPQVKRLIGRLADDPTWQQESQDYFLISTVRADNGHIGIEVDTSQGQATILPEQALAPYLSKLKQFTSRYLEGLPIRDCVITCPNYFDDAQRRSLLTAARLADLNVLRLMNESTAIALNYGILRQLPQDTTQRVIFCDIGEANTQVSVVDVVHGKLTMRYVAIDPFLGGRNFDLILFKYFSNLWHKQNSTPISSSKRATLRLMRECNGVKKILSSNRDCVISLDCFLDDVDFTLRIDRETGEKEWEPLLQNILKPLKEAIEETKKDNIKIHSVEMVGGTSRIPSVQDKILQYIKSVEPDIQALSWTLNGDESAARGAALMCAMLSPIVKVKEFQIQDINTWPVAIDYLSEKGAETEQLLINRLNPLPCTAKATFYKTQTFDFKLKLPSKLSINENTVMNVDFPFLTHRNIGTFTVNGVPLSENLIGDPKIKVSISLNKHGLVDWPQATLLETVKRIEPPANDQKSQLPPTENKSGDSTVPPTKTEDTMDVDQQQSKSQEQKSQEQQNTSDQNKKEPMDVDGAEDVDKKSTNADSNVNENKENTDNANKDAKNNADASNANSPTNNDANAKPEEKKSDKKKIQRNLQVTGKFDNEILLATFNKWYEFEASLWATDTVIHETHERRNELETYIYNTRNKLEGSHKNYASEAERNKLQSKLQENEEWLYGEGEDANKSSYVERLKALHELSDAIDDRYREGSERPKHIEQLKKLIGKYQSFATTDDPQYSHITEEEKNQVKDNATKCDEWLMQKIIEQGRIPNYEKPILTTRDVDDKYRELLNQCKPILNKPKPEPPKEEKKEDKPNASTDANANANANPNPNANTTTNGTATTDGNANTNANTNANANANANANEQQTNTQSSNQKANNADSGQQPKGNKEDAAFASQSDPMDIE